MFLGKSPSIEKYKGKHCINASFVVYYYNTRGLRVFNRSTANFIEVYNGHFFKRYNERMKLNLDKPLDIVKSYFMYGGHSAYSIVPKNEKEYTIGISKEGILLGELSHNRLWLINKTFISRDISNPYQDRIESELIASLQMSLEESLGSTDFIEDDVRIHKNVVNAMIIIDKD